jgi:serine/threonine-protein kinase
VAGVLFLGALATVALIVGSLLRGPGGPKLMVVPRLVGLPENDVATRLPPKARWQLQYSDARKDGTQPGEILAQDPVDGLKLTQGGTLHLTRSQGDELRTITASDFVNLPRTEAVAKLKAMGLVSNPIGPKFDEQVPADWVLEVPEAGKQVAKGGTVTLVISNGPQPRTLPDFAKQTPDQVKAALAGVGLQYAERQDYSETVGKGAVIGTEPAAGQPVPKGSVVTTVISIGRKPITVPPLIGQLAADAADKLDALGLKSSTNGPSNRQVIGTDPPAGETLYRGDSVTIYTRQT